MNDTRHRLAGAFPLLAGGITLFFVVQLTAILVAGGGAFAYTLDDPYIHLSVAEQLRQGHYGINPGEFATPSSSVLWPFLLVATADTALHAATPLVLNFAATLACGWLLLRLLDLVTGGASTRRPVLAAAVAAAPLLLLNWAGVAFTGMEHSTHILATLAVGVGLVQVASGRAVPWWLVAGLIVGPSLRYEGLAVTLAAAGVLFWWGHRRTALLSAAVAVLPLIAFSAWAVSVELDPLPSSVLVKSGVASGDGLLASARAVLGSVLEAALHPAFNLLVVALFAHLLIRRSVTALHVFALFVLAAHAAAGQFGWFSRYELYVFAAVLPVLAHLACRPLQMLFERPRTGRYALVGALAVAALSTDYVLATANIPLASRNIEAQQAQMARFVSDYWQEPVAVNDLGLVAYRGGQPVLDLWGLASQEAREARAASDASETAWMQGLTEDAGARLAMIYHSDRWFPEVPDDWTEVGRLQLKTPKITSAESTVVFFATTPEAIEALRVALYDFAGTLPPTARMEVVGRSGTP